MSVNLIDFISALNEDFDEFCEASLGEYGITRGQVAFIIYIGGHPNCSASELAAEMSADSGYTARLIKKLVEYGLATKRRVESDKRSCMLSLTQLGMQRFEQCQQMNEQWERRVVQRLDSAEREIFMGLIGKIGLG